MLTITNVAAPGHNQRTSRKVSKTKIIEGEEMNDLIIFMTHLYVYIWSSGTGMEKEFKIFYLRHSTTENSDDMKVFRFSLCDVLLSVGDWTNNWFNSKPRENYVHTTVGEFRANGFYIRPQVAQSRTYVKQLLQLFKDITNQGIVDYAKKNFMYTSPHHINPLLWGAKLNRGAPSFMELWFRKLEIRSICASILADPNDGTGWAQLCDFMQDQGHTSPPRQPEKFFPPKFIGNWKEATGSEQ